MKTPKIDKSSIRVLFQQTSLSVSFSSLILTLQFGMGEGLILKILTLNDCVNKFHDKVKFAQILKFDQKNRSLVNFS